MMKLAGLKSIDGAHDESVWAATWVPATESRPALLLTGSLDESVKLWRPDELVLQRTNTDHCLGVVFVAAHPSGVIAASASFDSFVRVFDVDTKATIATLEVPPSEVWQMRFNPKDPAVRNKAPGQSNYGGGAFYTTNPGTNSRLSPLPHEPAGFNYDGGATFDIPLDAASTGPKSQGLKRKEKELQAKEAELRKREQEVKRKEDAAARAGIVLEEKNWPPFFPIIHHDIANEIPIHLQKLQYLAFSTFLGVFFFLSGRREWDVNKVEAYF